MNEEDERARWDEEERRQFYDFKVGNRRTPLSNNVLMLLGDLLQPQTTGFPQVNMDMSFTNLNDWDLYMVENSSFIINYCEIYHLLKPLFIERGKLATRLVAKRSFNAKSMELFTNTVSTQKQEFSDKTEQKTGFTALFSRKKKPDQGGN